VNSSGVKATKAYVLGRGFKAIKNQPVEGREGLANQKKTKKDAQPGVNDMQSWKGEKAGGGGDKQLGNETRKTRQKKGPPPHKEQIKKRMKKWTSPAGLYKSYDKIVQLSGRVGGGGSAQGLTNKCAGLMEDTKQ